ncbi:MAG: M56 family metallopeptidase [Gemmatimonadota bacterium]
MLGASRTVDGVEVLVSRRTGPAAVGVLRGRVVLPEWTLSLAGPRRRLLVMHEAEHVRARDPQLALFGLLVCALMPWNLPLWWQLRRLRLSIEVDCDARVLRRTGDRRGYGSLLLEVGQRRTRLALGLAEPMTMLERRIRMIATTTRKATLRAAGLAVAAGLVLAVACETPGPTAQTAELDAEPALTAMTVQPRLRNQEQVGEALRDHYPPALRDAGIEGTANVRLFIDEDGHVRNARINRTGGHEALDEAATRVARQMEFTPAYEQDRPVPVWVAMDVRFALDDGPADGGEGAAAGAPDAAAADNRADAPGSEASERAGPGTEPYPESPREVSEAPTFTPMTEAPRLQNATETSERLQAHYPTELRAAGIGGTANVWFFIDAEGAVKKAVVNRGSGYPALDEAALEVARLMEFTPARNRDEPVPVWVALDIRFRAE